MSIRRERNGKEITFVCDDCGCTPSIQAFTDDFKEALDMAKEEGWVARKIGEEWCHFCEECK